MAIWAADDDFARAHQPIALLLFHLLWRHGLHRGRAGQQAGGAWPAVGHRSDGRAGPAGGGGGYFRLPAAGHDFKRGGGIAWPCGGDTIGADRLPAADRVDPAVDPGAGGPGGRRHGPGAGRCLRADDGWHAAHMAGRDHRLWHFPNAERDAVRGAQGAGGQPAAVVARGDGKHIVADRRHAAVRDHRLLRYLSDRRIAAGADAGQGAAVGDPGAAGHLSAGRAGAAAGPAG